MIESYRRFSLKLVSISLLEMTTLVAVRKVGVSSRFIRDLKNSCLSVFQIRDYDGLN